jgi:hypothetical protein
MIRSQIDSLISALEGLGYLVGEDDAGNEKLTAPLEARIAIGPLDGLDAGNRPGRLFACPITVSLRVRRVDGIEGYLQSLEEVERCLTALTALEQSSVGGVSVSGVELTRGGDYRGAVVSLRVLVSTD